MAVPVIQQYLNAECAHILIDCLRRRRNGRRFMAIDGNDNHVEGGYAGWPDHATVVVILFDNSGDQASDAHAITAHAHDHGFAMFVKDGGIQRL